MTKTAATTDLPSTLQQATELLGGRKILGRLPRDAFDVHVMLSAGLPGRVLVHLVDQSGIMQKPDLLEKAVGISLRTLQRRHQEPGILTREQSSRTWRFAELLSQAIEVFGSQAEAEKWFERPALGLNQQRPIDLIATAAGQRLVEDFLVQLEHGVYV